MLVLEAVLPVALVALLGYGARRFSVFSAVETDAIERISLWFLLPCLLFTGTATAVFPEPMNWQFLGYFYLVVLLVYMAGMAAGRLLFGLSLQALSVFGMAGAYSNVTVLGIPVTLAVLGDAAFIPMLVIIAIHNLVLFTIGTLLAEYHGSHSTGLVNRLGVTAREVLKNPICGSLIAGTLFNLSGLSLYAPLRATLDLMGSAAIPGALLGLGAAMVRYRIRGDLKVAMTMVILKLVGLPLAMWAMMQLAGFDRLWSDTAVLMSAMPVGISVYVFSRRYNACENAAASAIVLSSLLGIVTITVVVWLLS
jgi:malonate transporter